MQKPMIILALTLIALHAGADGTNPWSKAATTEIPNGTHELITDQNFARGLSVIPMCMTPDLNGGCPENKAYSVSNPLQTTKEAPYWQLAQWGSLSNLPTTGTKDGDEYRYADQNKAISFFKDGRIRFAVNGMNELGGKYLSFSNERKWPHLLIQQTISGPGGNRSSGPLNKMSSLVVSIDAHLNHNADNIREGYDKEKHASIFPMYFTVQNLNKESPGYGQYVWLGIPLYDNRDEKPGKYVALDDGTKMLIYTIPYSKFADKSLHSGDWVTLKADILQEAKEAVATAAGKGYVKSANINDSQIGGMNVGFELGSLNISTIEFKNLSLKVTVGGEPLLAKGFYRINGGDGIFYSNGTDAFCTFVKWETFVKWRGGRTDTKDVGSRPTVPANMRNDGICH